MSNSRRLTIGQNIDSGESGGGSINTSNYMTILALEDGLTAKLSTNACQYCIDGDGNWIDLPANTATQSINQGQTLSFKGNLTPSTSNGIGKFTISKKCNLAGNCMSLLFGDNAANNNSLSGKNYAFYKLFYNCTSIMQVSESFLPATILANDCYYWMFGGCTSLTTAPQLPATTLAYGCYYQMFSDCSSLTSAPSILPATTLANSCYDSMFADCTSLTAAPQLPATTLTDSCYSSMFSDCTSLTTAPELPATTLASYCYYDMFNGTNVLPDCSNIDFTSNTVVGSGGLRGLFRGTKVTDNDLYNILPINPSTGKYWLPATTLASSCYYDMFRGCTSLTTAPELPATTLASYCYRDMFYNCTSLTAAPQLPATTLANSCYRDMFCGCSSLTSAPSILPATTLAENCYYNMFYGCSSLTTAPELPATTLTDSCYSYMFRKCTSLTVAPELPATTLAIYCYYYMFNGCTSLTTAPELPATTLVSRCYSYMFEDCTSLTTAPQLPATTLTDSCYSYMFRYCSKLNYIKMLATDISASSCLYDWVYNVASTGTFVKNPAMTSLPTGSSGIPNGWTVVNDEEESGGSGNSGSITFSIQDSDGLITEYTIPYKMTWEEFINSDLNETKMDSLGYYYKQFAINNDIPAYALLYDGEFDMYAEIYIIGIGYMAKNQYIESKLYFAD